MMKQQTILQIIGNTPLIRLPLAVPAKVYAKLEYLNPGGSIKDRSALYMVEHAEKQGILKPGGTLVDASSGNHGIAIAMIGAAKGYRVIITVSEKVSREKVQTLKAYGAEVVVCPATDFIEDPRGYHSVACQIQAETPNSFMPNQYFNVVNAEGHYHSLGPEIWNQTDGTITHFFAGAGTGGTISGVGKYLKERNPDVKIIAIDSVNSFRATKGNPKPYKIEGLGIDFVSPVLDLAIIDDFVEVDDDSAFSMITHLAHKHGLLVGLTSGAVAHAVAMHASKLNENDVVVMICGDSGRAYLSKNLF